MLRLPRRNHQDTVCERSGLVNEERALSPIPVYEVEDVEDEYDDYEDEDED